MQLKEFTQMLETEKEKVHSCSDMAKEIEEIREFYKNVVMNKYPRQYVMYMEEAVELSLVLRKIDPDAELTDELRYRLLEEIADVIISIQSVWNLSVSHLSHFMRTNSLVYFDHIERLSSETSMDKKSAIEHAITQLLESHLDVSKALRRSDGNNGVRNASKLVTITKQPDGFDITGTLTDVISALRDICYLYEIENKTILAAVAVKLKRDSRRRDAIRSLNMAY